MNKPINKRILVLALLFAFSFALAGCAGGTTTKTTPPAAAPKKTAQPTAPAPAPAPANTALNQYLVVEPGGKLGPDGKLHDAYINGDLTLTRGQPVTLHFLNYDGGQHSYTCADLGLNVILKGSPKKGQPQETTYTFTPNKTGTFTWICTLKCDGQNNQWAMTHQGYMQGKITITNDTTQHVSLVINPGYKLGPDGKLHDAYTPGDFTISSGSPVQLTIYNFDQGTHTFTSTAMGVNIKVSASTKTGSPSVTTATFTPKAKGSYKWQCMDPCDGQNGQWAMTHDNYMMGTVTVK